VSGGHLGDPTSECARRNPDETDADRYIDIATVKALGVTP
jgi:hypothetical protein